MPQDRCLAFTAYAYKLDRRRQRRSAATCGNPLESASLAGIAKDDSLHTPLYRAVVPADMQRRFSARISFAPGYAGKDAQHGQEKGSSDVAQAEEAGQHAAEDDNSFELSLREGNGCAGVCVSEQARCAQGTNSPDPGRSSSTFQCTSRLKQGATVNELQHRALGGARTHLRRAAAPCRRSRRPLQRRSQDAGVAAAPWLRRARCAAQRSASVKASVVGSVRALRVEAWRSRAAQRCAAICFASSMLP